MSCLDFIIVSIKLLLSAGMFLIISWSRKKTVLVPCVLVALWPYAMLPNSMANAFIHVSFVNGSVICHS